MTYSVDASWPWPRVYFEYGVHSLHAYVYIWRFISTTNLFHCSTSLNDINLAFYFYD